MSTRPLTNAEIFTDLLPRHDTIAALVYQHERNLQEGGAWDQIKGTLEQLPIPPRGLAFTDEIYGAVIIFPDANGMLHYTATDNSALVNEVLKPVFRSDPGYFELFADIAKRYGEVIAELPQALPALAGGLGIGIALLAGLYLFGRR